MYLYYIHWQPSHLVDIGHVIIARCIMYYCDIEKLYNHVIAIHLKKEKKI